VRTIQASTVFFAARNPLRPLARLAGMALLLLTSVTPGYALDMSAYGYAQTGTTALMGPAVMLWMRVPAGSDSTRRSRPTLTLSLGTVWRSEFGSQDIAGFHYASALEAGLTLSGDPVVRMGSIDMSSAFGRRMNAAGDQASESFCGRNLAACIVGGIASIGVGGLAMSSSSSSGNSTPASGNNGSGGSGLGANSTISFP
jgi:hypothetical protein